MLAVGTTHPAPFRKPSVFRRLTRKERQLEISSPIIPASQEPYHHQYVEPRSPRSPDGQNISPSPPTLPALHHTQPGTKTYRTHKRVDSGSFPFLPVAAQFSRASTRSTSSASTSTSTSSTSTSPFASPTRIPASAHPTTPFPSQTRIAPWTLFLTPAHVHALYTGFLPSFSTTPTRHDKSGHFVFSHGPDVHGKLKVHFHASPSGRKVAELFVVMDLRGEGAGRVVGVRWVGGDSRGGRRVVRGALAGWGVELEGDGEGGCEG